MTMAFTDRELNKRIDAFLSRASAYGTLGTSKKDDLLELLKEPDPGDWDAVRETLQQQKKRFASWLGITKKTAVKGTAGSIDNLLVLINSFILLFVILALLPVFYIYRETTWIIPVVLFCPLVHFLAFRLARNPEVSPSRTKNMHLFAAVVSIVPLFCLAVFVAGMVRQNGLQPYLAGAAGILWIVHLLLVALLIRTENGFYCALILSAIAVSFGLLATRHGFAGVSCLHLLLAMFLYCLAGRAGNGKIGISPIRAHAVAGVFLTGAFVGLCSSLVVTDSLPGKGYFVATLVLYAAALVFLPAAIQGEADRLSNAWLKNGWRALLASTWLFFGLALLARGSFGVPGLAVRGGEPLYLPLSVCLIMGLAWSLLLLYEQFLATNDFDLTVFGVFSFFLIVCLTGGYGILAFKVAHFPALLLAAGVFAATLRLRRQYAAVFPPEPGPRILPAAKV